jgi:uroporphyrinogen III methyltransferase / synthase
VAETFRSPLTGKRVVITRATLQSSELYETLTSRGAVPIMLPLVSFAPPESYVLLDAELAKWKTFDWVIFTSAFAVAAVTTRAAKLGRNLTKGGAPPYVAVVGPATRDQAEKLGFPVEHVAQTHLGVALAEELGSRVRGKRVLLPRSDRANPDLPAALQGLGATVTEVVAYRTLRPSDADQAKVNGVARGEADAILFFSPSAVHHFVELAGRERLKALQHRVAIAAIGPVTARALQEIGVQRVVTPAESTASSVVAALEKSVARNGLPPVVEMKK